MKKIIIIVLCLLSISIVNAATENVLIISEKNNKLYYDQKKFDDNTFMSHLSLVPGQVNEDTLVIKNNTEHNFDIYLTAKLNESNTEAAVELLENIEMKIYLNDDLVYEGTASGEDFRKIDLERAYKFGTLQVANEYNFKFVTKLSESYSNDTNLDISKTQWTFYAVTDDDIMVINPDTGDSINLKISYVLLGIAIVIMIGLGVYKKKVL